MTTTIKPTGDEKKIIRAAVIGGAKMVKLEIGLRVNLKDDRKSVNQLLIGDSGDCDLSDHKNWSETMKGFEGTDTGAAVIDIYVYDLLGLSREYGPEYELRTNAYAYFEGGRLVRVEENNRTVWSINSDLPLASAATHEAVRALTEDRKVGSYRLGA